MIPEKGEDLITTASSQELRKIRILYFASYNYKSQPFNLIGRANDQNVSRLSLLRQFNTPVDEKQAVDQTLESIFLNTKHAISW